MLLQVLQAEQAFRLHSQEQFDQNVDRLAEMVKGWGKRRGDADVESGDLTEAPLLSTEDGAHDA